MNLENTAERLAGLASLLYAGCGLPVWCFDKEGGLYFTTSAYGKELGMFLEIGGCKEFAMTKGTEHDRPFVMSDALGMVWVGEFVELTEDIGRDPRFIRKRLCRSSGSGCRRRTFPWR